MTRPLSELQRRHLALRLRDRAVWQEWERALARLVACSRRLERRRITWQERVAKAMRGVEPETWWRYHCRMETGELWVGTSAATRRLQRLVKVSSSVVLDLMARRDDDLRSLVSTTCIAAAELRIATVGMVAALGVRRVATVLGIPPSVVRALCRQEQPAALLGVLPSYY